MLNDLQTLQTIVGPRILQKLVRDATSNKQEARSKNAALESVSFLLRHAEKQDLRRFQNYYQLVTLGMPKVSKSMRRQALRLACLLHFRSDLFPVSWKVPLLK